MSPPAYSRNRPSPARRLVFVLLAVVLSGVGTIGALATSGILQLPWPRKPTQAAKPKPEGLAIPLSARPMEAFTLITREHLMDEKTADILAIHLPAEQVAKSGLLTFDKVVGRVLKKDHNAGYGFTEKDLLPPGTRPGSVAGVPPGKVMFVLDADKVMGIRGLRSGDRIDLLATMEIDHDKALAGYRGKGAMPPALYEVASPMTNLPRRAGMKVLVQDGTVVTPALAKQVPVPNSTVGPDGKPKTRTFEEVKIAVDPKEVAPLTEALAVRAAVFCVAHSGSPEGTIVPTPGSMPPPRIKTMEIIIGGKRDVLVFPNTDAESSPNRDRPRPGSKSEEKITPPKEKTPTSPSSVGSEGE